MKEFIIDNRLLDLGSEYYIVEEGLNGRTTNIDEKEEYT